VVLLMASSVVAAPAPLQKTPRSSERVWQLDLGPLLAAPKKSSFTIDIDVNARHSDGTHSEGVRFEVWGGIIGKVRTTDGFLISVLDRPPAEGIRQALADDLREALGLEAVAHGDVIEFRALRGTPVSEVIVAAKNLDNKFAPVVKLARRWR
jgi:hypothetical protein